MLCSLLLLPLLPGAPVCIVAGESPVSESQQTGRITGQMQHECHGEINWEVPSAPRAPWLLLLHELITRVMPKTWIQLVQQ